MYVLQWSTKLPTTLIDSTNVSHSDTLQTRFYYLDHGNDD